MKFPTQMQISKLLHWEVAITIFIWLVFLCRYVFFPESGSVSSSDDVHTLVSQLVTISVVIHLVYHAFLLLIGIVISLVRNIAGAQVSSVVVNKSYAVKAMLFVAVIFVCLKLIEYYFAFLPLEITPNNWISRD